MKYLGHLITRQGILPDPSTTSKIQEWPRPSNSTEVRAFLGLCSYYRRYVKGFSHKAAPLNRLTEAKVPFEWDVECEEAFTFLKSKLITPPVMAFPNFQKPFILHTDAANVAVGSVLSQLERDGSEKVVAYASHKLSPNEKKWSTYDRELRSVVWSMRHFRHYLSTASCTIITDHKPLLGLKSMPIESDRTGRRVRWLIELQGYDYEIKYRQGKSHANADSLSRIQTQESNSDLGPPKCLSVDQSTQTSPTDCGMRPTPFKEMDESQDCGVSCGSEDAHKPHHRLVIGANSITFEYEQNIDHYQNSDRVIREVKN